MESYHRFSTFKCKDNFVNNFKIQVFFPLNLLALNPGDTFSMNFHKLESICPM